MAKLSQAPDARLTLLDTPELDAHRGERYTQHPTRADLLRRLDRPTCALPHCRQALELAPPTPSADSSSAASGKRDFKSV